ncbi:unnamed protein product [Cuscuta epithymum]|uniref:Uncharacterized protein n=1 Tax=Cuscuta epithymum TaxID=186058 RepID=A0AAV0FGV0_9ASTE|nr:unnamed protein product [Cuscuta epithymum]
MSLCFMKPTCSFEIILGKILFKREAIILVHILLKKLERQMGLKSAKVAGLSFLGIRTIKALDIPGGMGCPKKNSCTALNTSSLTIDQHFLKNFPLYPSGLAALF